MSDDQFFKSEITGLWTPSCFKDPKHELYMLNRITDVDLTVKHCRKTAVCVQAGGYVGYWPLRLAKTFSVVHTVEPLIDNYEALLRNIEHVPGIIPHYEPLSSDHGIEVDFSIRKGWGSRIGADPNRERVEKRKTTCIDAMPLTCCDAILLDIEGHELEALKGAEHIISKFRPVITLEVWDVHAKEYNGFMNKLGYRPAVRSHMDTVYIPEERA
jgi:FkbM family methyltransferase